jgi:hypothetical protein
MTTVLVVVGVVAEFAGIVLLGFPDFVPGALRLSDWLRRQTRRAVNRLGRLVGREPPGVVVSAGAALATGVALGARAIVSTGATTLEGKLEYLLRRDQDAQRQADEFAARLNRLEAESPRRLAETRQQMEEHVARELSAALEAYRPLRVAGTIALALGLACVTLATLLG